LIGGHATVVPPHDELWSLNACYRWLPKPLLTRCTRWFELHNRAWLKGNYGKGREGKGSFADHVKALDKLRIPVYQWKPWPEIRQAIAYPKTTIELSTSHGRYHCGSFDWMVALAIHEEAFCRIDLYGIDLGPLDGEPISARPALEYWLGVAEGSGMTVTAYGGSLFSTFQLVQSRRQYGFEDVENVIYE
jgi:hypothetical protein